MRGLTRGRLIHHATVGGIALLAGGPALAAARAAGDGDAGRIRTALALSHIQARLYSQAERADALRPDLLFFARVAARHEEEHVAALAALAALAGPGGDPPRPDLWQVAADDAAFAHMAVRLEDLTVRALNGIAGDLSPGALEATSRVASVDARHAAWVRGLVGVTPSHHVFDRGRTRDEVTAVLAEAGLDPDLVP